jgi:DNA polymerase-3 subunit gamma/tau
MTYQVIARKRRPQTFAELAGQQHVIRTLQNAIRTGRLAHSYIFSGARGVGKTTTARILAKALNCAKGPAPEPCNECDSCREIAAGNSLDVLEIDAASNRGIDQVRELRDMVRYAPANGRYKVIILDEAHMLTTEASNALLKTLEEPPEKVVFVMATTEPEELAETIRSRSQHFHFRSLSFQEIVQALETIAGQESFTADPAALAVIARAADGSVRDALSLLEQALAYAGNHITAEQARELLGVVSASLLDELVAAIEAHSAVQAFELVHRLLAGGQNLQQFCREATSHFRNLLLARVCGADSELIAAAQEDRPRLARAASIFSEEDLTRFFQILLDTEENVRRKPDPRLQLEMGLLRLVQAARLAPLEEVIANLSDPSALPAARAQRGESPRSQSAQPAAPVAQMRAAAAAGAGRSSFDAPTTLKANATPAAASTAAPAVTPVSSNSEPSSAPPSDQASVAAIKSAVAAQQKFLAELVEHAHRWELDAAEVRLFFPTEQRALADLLQSRESMEKLRTITSTVMGRSLRVCVKLEAAPVSSSAMRASDNSRELRARFEQDPIVRAMLERFGGRIADVKDRGEG